MKVAQINAWNFKYLHELVAFLKAEKPDIINLQEVTSGKFNYCDPEIFYPFEHLKKELGYQGVFAPFMGLKADDGSYSQSGNGFLTSLEIIDSGIFFESTLPDYTDYLENHDLIKTTLKNEKSKYYNIFEEPKNYLWAVLKTTEGKYIRNLTSHFTVSYDCCETLQHIQQARSVLKFIESTKEMPIVFSGDLNIHDQAACIGMLSKELKMVNQDTANSLNKQIHPIFKNVPGLNGLRVDYIFQKGFQIVDYSVPEVMVSDHLPIIANLELLN
jgi:endonuclease/exonuclease/phosphatase family metal-dependent hydrolase